LPIQFKVDDSSFWFKVEYNSCKGPDFVPRDRHDPRRSNPSSRKRVVPHAILQGSKMSANETPFAKTPEPPYYAVIFTSQRTQGDRGYAAMAQRMVELAAQQPGFLGVESARGADGLGITVSYWSSEEAIAAWKALLEHKPAQEAGKRVW
jgi:heme-degrading monooxygenase HmoA